MKKILTWEIYALYALIPAFGFYLIIGYPLQVNAQNKRAVFGEMVTCNIKVASDVNPGNNQKANSGVNVPAKKEEGYKSYQPQLNQLGHFDRVLNIKPMQIVPVELHFPNGTAGEQVIITAIDGGTLEGGKKGNIEQLNDRKQLAFNFQVGKDLGLYRIIIKKGNDSKVIQLWVGAEQKMIQ